MLPIIWVNHKGKYDKDLEEGKYVKILGWEGQDAAKVMISKAIIRYNKSIGSHRHWCIEWHGLGHHSRVAAARLSCGCQLA